MSTLTAYDKFVQQALKYGFSLWGVPKTGQTIVYRTGDDGSYQRGIPLTGPRFIDNHDDTISDKATGLMWPKSKESKGRKYDDVEPWNTAIDYCNSLDFAGHTDWRLPNIHELFTLTNKSMWAPAQDPIFQPAWGGFHWASTTVPFAPTYAMTVSFALGDYSGEEKIRNYKISAVRGGVPTDP